jgi:integral membrane protein (TIGR01906 family)
MLDITVKRSESRVSNILTAIFRTYLILILPVLLVMLGVRLVMTPAFLYFEYTRPGFPEDSYGLTTEYRLNYAPYALNYLLTGEDIDFLSDLRFPDGRSLFNVRELQHMRDVKALTQIVYWAAIIGGLGAALAAFILGRNATTRRDVRIGLMKGSVLTLGIVAAIILAAIVNWDFFFTAFHAMVFESGTWRFAYSDTLIRLFPEQFWFDAALLIGGITTLTALVILWVTRRWEP